jgi:hypothetical protein
MARQSGRHMRGPAPAARKAPPCMWRGPGMELSDELYAQQLAWPGGGRRDAALNLLASVRDRFTEGFTTADLIRSAFILRELRSSE